jgi:tryptophan-rich sensory protein
VSVQKRLLLPQYQPGRALVSLLWCNLWFALSLAVITTFEEERFQGTMAAKIFDETPTGAWAVGWWISAALTAWGLVTTRHNHWRFGLLATGGVCVMWSIGLLLAGALNQSPSAAAVYLALGGIDWCFAALALEPRSLQTWFTAYQELAKGQRKPDATQ